MAIEDRNLKSGMKLVARYKGKDYTCEVVNTDDGLRFRLAGGQEFKSVSAAGSHVMGGTACNGWRFWSVEGQRETRAPYETGKPKSGGTEKPAPAKKQPAKRTGAKEPTPFNGSEAKGTENKAPETATVAPGSTDGDSSGEKAIHSRTG